MYETSADLQRLQAILDASIERATPFLRSSLQMPEKSFSAESLCNYLQDMIIGAFATITATGEPRVAPIGAIFYRGRFYIPTVQSAIRTRHIKQRSGVSFTHYDGTQIAIIIHGHGTIINGQHRDFARLDTIHTDLNGSSVNRWGKGDEGVFIRIDPDRIFTYNREANRNP